MNAAPCGPNLVATAMFLESLDPAGLFTFMTIPEGDRKGTGQVTVLHGTLNSHATRLTQLNNAGNGIFVMINDGDLKGRSAGNVIRVRMLFVDLDGAPVDPLLKPRPHRTFWSNPARTSGTLTGV